MIINKAKGYRGPERPAYFVECATTEDLNRALIAGQASHFIKETIEDQVDTPLDEVPNNSLIVLFRDFVEVLAEKPDGTRNTRPHQTPRPYAVGLWDAANRKVNWKTHGNQLDTD